MPTSKIKTPQNIWAMLPMPGVVRSGASVTVGNGVVPRSSVLNEQYNFEIFERINTNDIENECHHPIPHLWKLVKPTSLNLL